MKLKRLLILALVLGAVCMCFASCGKIYANVNVKFIDGDGKTIGETPIKVEGTEQNPPTALAAAEMALIELDFEKGYELTADGYSLKAVNGICEVDETGAEVSTYSYWRVYINGNQSSKGRQSEEEVYEGDEIEFRYESGQKEREDVKQTYAADEEAENID